MALGRQKLNVRETDSGYTSMKSIKAYADRQASPRSSGGSCDVLL